MIARAALLAAVFAAPAFAQSSDCDALRRVLAIADRSSVSVGDLARLEPELCGRPVARGSTCQQLDAFWMLALALEQPAELVGGLEAQRAIWCGRGDEPVRPLQWPGGSTLRSSSGRWSLPSGELADEGRIAALACQADLQWCRFFFGEVQRSSGLHRDFAMLGLGRLAGQAR